MLRFRADLNGSHSSHMGKSIKKKENEKTFRISPELGTCHMLRSHTGLVAAVLDYTDVDT